ncbi:hypothetical protein [Euryhalocaulis caribicus]|uniref:hypothetical protein n=1 Tax=Euryhalocaulis caribicus TaxID=1161401 RepID=UPI0003A2C419|nr:hypothetical protein [Euryhalocaulis caribicus]
MKYYDVFGEAGFHSAFMTTYAFSAQAFEDVPFPKLRGAGCRNIAILADKAMLNVSFAEYGTPRYAGALYHLAKVSVGGAFHPKMTLLVGPEKGRLLIGSANLTALGLAGNKELVADIRYTATHKDNAALFGEALNYLRSYIPTEDPWFADALNRALRYSPWLRKAAEMEVLGDQSDIRLLADQIEQSLLEQIKAAVAGDKIERLVVLSPYWDAKLQGLTRLREVLGMPPTDILIDPRAAQFPLSVLDSASVELFDLREKQSSRFVHAKAYIACGKEWDHVISGSMNCSLPALLGPTIPRGNAEMGLYKRVQRGMALRVLKLEGYRQTPLDRTEILPRLISTNTNDGSQSRDGGAFILRGHRLTWTPPAPASDRALSLQLHDRDGVEIGDPIQIDASSRFEWDLPNPDLRPRTARVRYEGGLSAPTTIVDLDALLIRTLPPHRGKKRKIADFLSETTYEDLFLLQAINELEMLDIGEQPVSAEHVGRTLVEATGNDEQPELRVLSYEAFVRARNRAKAEDGRNAFFLKKRQNGAADLVSMCLNRLIGFLASDLSSEDEDDLRRQSAIDLRNTEPLSEGYDEPETAQLAKAAEAKAARQRVKATAKKIEEAVKAFEVRSKSLAGRRVTTTELVRLRTLLQIILAYAQPAGGGDSDLHVLPISEKKGDWPRLVGRLLNQHFNALRALDALDVEADESEHHRVLEYLAFARYAAQIAVSGARSTGLDNPILKALDQLAKDVETQVRAMISQQEDDTLAIGKINDRLNERFTVKLMLDPIPPP